MIIREMAFMKKRTTIAMLLAAALLSGCASSTDGETMQNDSGDNVGATTPVSTSDTTTSSTGAPEESMNDWWFTIEDGVLTKCSTVASGVVTIPDGVTEIGREAFADVTDVTAVTVPSGVTQISANAFKNCKNLKTLTLSEGLTTIQSSAFSGCEALSCVELPASIEFVFPSTFNGYSGSIKYGGETYSADDPEKLCKAVCYDENGFLIKDGILYDVLDSESGEITIPDTVVEIAEAAFINKDFSKITVPGSVKKINDHAFINISYLSEIVFEEGVTSLGDELFNGSSVLRVVLPSTLTDIKEYSLQVSGGSTVYEYNGKEYRRNDPGTNYEDDWCKLFTTLMPQYNEDGLLIENGILVDALFCADHYSEELVIPEGVTVIGEGAFTDSEYSFNIKLPQSLTEIKDKAFWFTCIREIEIPDGVKSIGAGAFSGCSSLTRVVLPDRLEYLGKDAFKMCDKAVIEYKGEQYTPDGIAAVFGN